MLRVGLTGGIGAGKSSVSSLLASYGAVVVDADVLAREALAPGSPGLAQVVQEFGPDVLAPDGALDRGALAAVVFTDASVRERLNAIVHPRVRAAARELEAQAGPDAVVVHDVPLLVETGQAGAFDAVVVVAAAPETQVARLVQQRGMTEQEARARIAAQAPLADKLAVATHVIRNNGPQEELEPQVERVWAELTGPSAPCRRTADP